MSELFAKLMNRVAPRAMADLADLSSARQELGDLTTELHSLEARLEMLGIPDIDRAQRRVNDLTLHLRESQGRIAALEAEVAELREEIDETRRDGRRVAELYDLVFERLRGSQL